MSPARRCVQPEEPLSPRLFAGLFGAFLGLTLLKFGTPPLFEHLVSPPANAYEFVLNTPWPIAWAYGLLGLVALLGLWVLRWRPGTPLWLVVLPALWLIWEWIAGFHTVDSQLTLPTLKHFTATALCFYLGFFCLGNSRARGWFWGGLSCAFLVVLAVGWEQHFGGLEETRRYFFAYLYPQMKEVSPDYLKKISSNRIFSTLFYPNALAGAVLLFLPAILVVIAGLSGRLTAGARAFVAAVIAIGSFGCLYWSGSKGGWLLMLILGLVAAMRWRFSKPVKTGLIAAVLLIGLAGFTWKYLQFFQHGATSVVARLDYWRAALRTTVDNPLFGTGPGTFYVAYEKLRSPAAEPARLAHNDYLEQASDSGLPGAVIYAVFIAGLLWRCWPWGAGAQRWTADGDAAWASFSIWLGVLGWALQGFFEFGLYIPALAWPAFAFMGCLLAGTPTGRQMVDARCVEEEVARQPTAGRRGTQMS